MEDGHTSVEDNNYRYRYEKMHAIVKAIDTFVVAILSQKSYSREELVELYTRCVLPLPEKHRADIGELYADYADKYVAAHELVSGEKTGLSVAFKEFCRRWKICAEKYKKVGVYGGTLCLRLPRGHHIFGDSQAVCFPWEQVIVIPDHTYKSRQYKKHEYMHYLTHMGLSYENDPVIHMIKDEMLARYSVKAARMEAADNWLPQYVLSFTAVDKDIYGMIDFFDTVLGKYTTEYTADDFNMRSIDVGTLVTVCRFFRKKNEKVFDEIIELEEPLQKVQKYIDMGLEYDACIGMLFSHEYEQRLVPHYFESRDQIVYLFAVTPVVFRKSLVRYYVHLLRLEENAADGIHGQTSCKISSKN